MIPNLPHVTFRIWKFVKHFPGESVELEQRIKCINYKYVELVVCCWIYGYYLLIEGFEFCREKRVPLIVLI